MISKRVRESARYRRKRRIRKKIFGTAQRPRLTVFRSNRHIYIQIIDDLKGHTLVSASTQDSELSEQLGELDKKGAAVEVGKLAARRAKDKGIEQVVFDRNGYIYHGRVAAIADGAREAGLQF